MRAQYDSEFDRLLDRARALLGEADDAVLGEARTAVMHAVRRDRPARRDVRPLVEDTVFHLPFLGPVMNRIGGVRADPENAERLLLQDELVAVFPEASAGRRSCPRSSGRPPLASSPRIAGATMQL